MGIFSRLFDKGPRSIAGTPASPSLRAEVVHEERIDVVGESNYQPAIRRACGWTPGTDTRFECFAEVVPEPTNRYDPNAIRVDIDGACVGYLSRADALQFGPAIREALASHGTQLVRAVIAGRADGETDNLGVFLHMTIGRQIAADDPG